MSNAKHGKGARWLRSLSRAWVVASLVLLVGFSVLAGATGNNVLGLVCIAIAVIAVAAYYTVALLLLRDEGKVKTGLALLVAGGLPASATIFAATVLGYDQDSNYCGAAVAALFAVAQVGMITSAIAAYYAGNRAAGDRSLLARCFTVAVAMFGGLTLFVLPPLGAIDVGGRIAANESSARQAMRTINTAEITFASTYNKGFTDGLNRMGAPETGQPDENRADLLDPVLAGLAPGSTNRTVTYKGYEIVYTPGPGRFGTITTYTLVARPVQYHKTGTTSFYTDQTTVIRATTKNQAATANDPPLGDLAGHREGALPAAILSGTLLLACVAFYLFVHSANS
jgi:hypothetical protein